MKRLVIFFFGFFLFAPSVFALPGASATFFSKRGEPFQFILNGRLVNRGGTNVIRLHDLPAGYHTAEFRLPGRRGVLVHRTRILLEPGLQSDFMLLVAGPRQLLIRKVAETPLLPIYRQPRRERGYNPYGQNERYDQDNRYGNNNRYDEEYGTEDSRGGDYSRDESCRDVLAPRQVEQLLQSMADKTETGKQSIARQALRQNTVLSEDLKAILQQFDFESTRLDFAKFAYDATCDRRNFYQVNDAFTYETSIRELERYLNQR